MSNSIVSKTSAYGRYKLALIAVLGLVFAAILFWQARHQSNPLSAEMGIQPQARATSIDKAFTTSWPSTTLAEVSAFNPFDPPPRPTAPDASEPEATSEPQTTKAPPAISSVQAVYEDRRGTIAILNSKVVRVGDYLDGRRVLDISAKGVVLELSP